MPSKEKTVSEANLSLNGDRAYAITIKRSKNDRQALQSCLDSVADSLGYDVTDRCYELDSKRKLHLHGIFYAPTNLTYKTLMRKGWHVYIKPMTTIGWHNYIKKHSKCQSWIDQTCYEHISSHWNMFDEHMIHNYMTRRSKILCQCVFCKYL